EAVSPAGFLELTVDGQPHSSDPASAAFDPQLAGATRTTLTGLRFDAPGGDATLTLGTQQLARGLRVSAPAARVVAEDLTLAGPLEVDSGSHTFAGGVTLYADGSTVTARDTAVDALAGGVVIILV